MALSKQQLHFKGPYHRQNWSLPDSLVYNLTINPSNSKAWQKLVQSCKYFFFKNPILVIKGLCCDRNGKWAFIKGKQTKYIDLNDDLFKLWITVFVDMSSFKVPSTAASSIIPKLYRCDAKKIYLCEQNILYDDLLFLTSSVKHMTLCRITVTNRNGTIIPLERLVKDHPYVKTFIMYCDISPSNITSKTAKELLKISHFSTIQKFSLRKIPEIFDIETFYTYLKKNHYTKFDISFSDSISVPFKNRLESIIDEIIETENHDYEIPAITDDNSIFSCITKNTVKELLKISHFSKIHNFGICRIPEIFDIETMYSYIKENQQTAFWISFPDKISMPFRIRVEAIIDEIIGTKNHDYKPPFIDFDGLRNWKRMEMRSFLKNFLGKINTFYYQ